ncbi:MAG TPA: prephenate dehydrogenase/arogenate dehydrogenase family protein [Candidatus Eisenbacteria bacterium]|nr:prephenate dehydrogenase/arogenate dehydrogenase family protein [Candidatus Eisenbacteria bacterium]
MPDELAQLRARIAALDTEIVRLAAERFALVREVGETKRAEGVPVRSFTAEADVIARYRAAAREKGLPEGFAERLALQLIAGAVQLQEEALPGSRPAASRRITIVGGAGKMGRWLAEYFAGQGHEVSIHDPAGDVPGFPSEAGLEDVARNAEIVVLATPLGSGRAVLQKVLALEPKGIVADIFSLKSHVMDLLRNAASQGQPVTSLHPLYGPDVRTLSGRTLAVCDCGHAGATEEATALFQDTALTITLIPVERHDEIMQYVLGLSHLVSILFFTTLTESGVPFATLEPMASTTFHKQMRAAAAVASESPQLYYEIQKLNRHSAELFEKVRASLELIEQAAHAGDSASFTKIMNRGHEYFPLVLPQELD